jgi:siroheme synthase-like protein
VDRAPRVAAADLDGAWLVVAAATPEVNREVAAAAEARRIFVNAVDDPANASAFLSGTVRRDGVTIAVSTSGRAPALTALLREALDKVLPADLDRWMAEAVRQRAIWRRDQIPMAARKPLLLHALNEMYTNGPADRLRLGSGRQEARTPQTTRDRRRLQGIRESGFMLAAERRDRVIRPAHTQHRPPPCGGSRSMRSSTPDSPAARKGAAVLRGKRPAGTP